MRRAAVGVAVSRCIVGASLLLAGTLAACSDGPTDPVPRDISPQLAAVTAGGAREVGDTIPGQFIVQFTDDIADDEVEGRAHAIARALHGSLRHIYHGVAHGVKGFSIELPTPAAEASLRHNPAVKLVEPNTVVSITTTETNAPWALDRIDQRSRSLNGLYRYDWNGSGVHIYILDTGIRITHDDFGTRASVGYDALGGNGLDCNGHGTHVAGLAGGTTYGVAKAASLVSVRVLGCDGHGTWDDAIAGIQWVSAHHINPAVVNMSLGGGPNSTVETELRNLIANGVSVVVAAGNDSQSACNFSPARVGEAITVAATTSSDARASFSNYGTCVDLFAPGQSVLSDWNGSDTDTRLDSGTSMASPLVAGVVALLRQRHPGDSPARLADSVTAEASSGVVSNAGTGSPNRLLYSSPPPAFSVLIDGPGFITTTGTYTWTALPSHGVSPFTYDWEIAYDATGGDFGPLRSGSSVSFTVIPSDGNFTLRVTGHSADGQTAVGIKRVLTSTDDGGGGGGGCIICS